jgi:hypothetical protein
MHTGKHSLTPLAAVAGGLLAGAVSTLGLDAVHYLEYRLENRRRGDTQRPLAWEFAPVKTWEQAPDPGQVAKRVIEGFTQRKLADRWAWPISTGMHWAYGASAGALYGILAGSLRSPRAAYGLPFGAAVWAAGYAILPAGGLYKPIWEYDADTLVWDLAGHLAYGAGTGVTFLLFVKALD